MESPNPDRGETFKAVRAISRFFDETVGWNRIGFLLSITIIALAGVALFRHLRDTESTEVIDALLGIVYAPGAASAIDQLPAWFNRGAAILTLVILAIYIGWVWRRPRTVGRSGWQVTLPDGPLTLLQIGIGIIDLSFCALAMYMLVPDEPNIGFVTLAVIFVSATLLGFASHAPGGIGVFDAAMLVALWQYDKEELLAGLLLFRLLYYLIPFALSLAILGARDVMLRLGRGPPRTG